MKYTVYGTAKIGISIIVDADDDEDALRKAEEEFDGLTNYAGNGGSGKLVGTTQSSVELNADCDVDFTAADSHEDPK